MKLYRRPGAARGPRPPSAERGVTLTELLLAVFVMALLVGAATPALGAMWRRAALRAAAHDLAGLVRRLRHEAAAQARYQAWVFSRSGERWMVQRFGDGNGNGIRAVDLQRGVDRPLGDPLDLSQRWSPVRLALPDFPVPRIPPARGVLAPGSDPLRLSGTDRISCGPNGACTGGTLYLSAGGQEASAVVVYGITGRVRVWRYEPASAEWIRY